MRIREIRLSGFKSFADPVSIALRPGLTGVIGPNGCGKSNIVEAIRWAMGETAPSTIRIEDLDDIIFAGSGGRPRHPHAEVTIELDPRGVAIPGEPPGAPTAEVSRRVARGGASVFRINGRDARARDIRTLFGDAGTGSRSFSIVRQNRIGELIAAKPIERRRILEDAAGVTGLHQRRHEIQLRLNATARNLELVEQNLAQLERQHNALRRQSKRAGIYRGISARLRRTESLLAYANWRKVATDEARLAAEGEDCTRRLKGSEAELNIRSADRQQAVDQLPPLRKRHVKAVESLARAESEAGNLERRMGETKARINQLQDNIGRLESDILREQGLVADATASLAELDAKETAREGDDPQSLAMALAASETETRERAVAVEETEREFNALGKSLAETEAQLVLAAQQESEARRRLERLEGEASTLHRDTKVAVSERDKAVAAHKEALPKCRQAEQTLAAAKLAAQEADTAHQKAAATEREAHAELGEISRLAAAREAQRSTLGEIIASHVEAGATPVATQSRANEGYELAMAAALGDDLQLPVVTARDTTSGWVEEHPPAAVRDLPAGTVPLTDHVQAPVALKARIAQVGLVEASEGNRIQAHLAAGQRLVSREGALWRWDGLRLAPGHSGGLAARQLAARNRLRELDADAEGFAERKRQATRKHDEARRALARLTDKRDAAGSHQRECAEMLADLAAETGRLENAANLAEARLASLRSESERVLAERDAARERLRHHTDDDGKPDTRARDQQRHTELRGELESRRRHELDARTKSATIREQLRSIETACEQAESARSAWTARLKAAQKRETDTTERLGREREALAAEQENPAELALRQSEIAQSVHTLLGERGDAERALATAEKKLKEAEEALGRTQQTHADNNAALTRCNAQLQLVSVQVREAVTEIESVFGCEPAMVPARLKIAENEIGNAEQYQQEIESLRAERERIGPVNLQAEAELRDVASERDALAADKADLDHAVEKFDEAIGSLNLECQARITRAFDDVNKHFQEVFATLFGPGSRAALELVGGDDPFESGLEILAQPPGKRLVSLAQMSGGEKALTAIALIFALFLSSPSPLCVLDEVDAPLDDANVQRFCDLLDEMTRRTEARFLVVTHHAITISRMDRLYGVTMAEKGVSQLVSVDYGAAIEQLAA